MGYAMTAPMTQPIIMPQGESIGDTLQKSGAALLQIIQHRQEMQDRQRKLDMQQQELDNMTRQSELTGMNMKSEIAQREAKIEAEKNELMGKNIATGIYGQMVASGLDPSNQHDWQLAAQNQMKGHIGKEYHSAMLRAFNGMAEGQIKTEGDITKQQLDAANAAKAKADAAVAGQYTLSPGQERRGPNNELLASGGPVPATDPQRKAASVAVTSIPAQKKLNDLEALDPNIPNKAFQKVAAAYGANGWIHKWTGSQDPRVIEAAVEATMNAPERAYYKLQKQYMSAILPNLSGANVTGNDLIIYGQPLFSMGSGNPALISQLSDARDLRIKNAIAESADAIHERIKDGSFKGQDLTRYGFTKSGKKKLALGQFSADNPMLNDPWHQVQQ